MGSISDFFLGCFGDIFFFWRYFVSFRKVNTYRLELTRRKTKKQKRQHKKKENATGGGFPRTIFCQTSQGTSCKLQGFLPMIRRVHSRVIWDRFLNANVFVGAFGLEIDIMGTNYFMQRGFSKDLSVWGGDSAPRVLWSKMLIVKPVILGRSFVLVLDKMSLFLSSWICMNEGHFCWNLYETLYDTCSKKNYLKIYDFLKKWCNFFLLKTPHVTIIFQKKRHRMPRFECLVAWFFSSPSSSPTLRPEQAATAYADSVGLLRKTVLETDEQVARVKGMENHLEQWNQKKLVVEGM